MRFEFEWHISDPQPDGSVYVRERIAGRDDHNLYGPMRRKVAESFIKARRAFVHRTVTNKFSAMQIFEPRPNLQLLGERVRRSENDYDA